MQAEIDKLREEISALDTWIEVRTEEIQKALSDRQARFRILLRAPADSGEMGVEQGKIEELKKELDSLNGARQVRMLKAEMLRKMESGEAQ